MPRQLPWAGKAGSSRTQVKAPPRKKQRVVSAVDDDFFGGTILAGSKKGKERAVNSDDDLSDLAVESKTPRTNLLGKGPRSADRAPSSSPPPEVEVQPTVEPMRKGVSKFDLRDDEWMMVEDEFLETANLFTRHLHIAEYQRLKETIEAKKKEVANEIQRPVVPNAKLSFESAIKEKARLQARKQKEAIRDVLETQHDPFITPARISTAPSHMSSDSDGEDLDAIQRPPRRALPSKQTPTATTPRPTISTPQPLSKSKPKPYSTPKPTATSPTPTPHPFKKPAPPNTPNPRTRPPRPTPFDMLDDYLPKIPTTPAPNPSLFDPHATASPTASPSSTPIRKMNSDTQFRGKHEREDYSNKVKKEEKKKQGAVQLDDIPTFLF
ncbi:hypothetical protein IAQ61_005756 [Plenodomus lingam]|uniref:Predicted protein n=1 Tax=Leptosphaeria maculans (strain JN3 / isolate v23.1.3 / race Av1-4-5-6-7-8) TaxID=985895 RepID=E4ZMM1_LEPMJ|nr:predicted protein [Plenodomus lingam JN3]KAH9870283.1 hypothetical protein IAQ61_005756 [Plenodomus lingam]CBX92890.1 predicted protein [Plenodomus lingam JN3]